MYILAAQRDKDVVGAFSRYTQYLRDNKENFPESAYMLATSDWYFSNVAHRAPHDARLTKFQINEFNGASSALIRLRSAFDTGFIEFRYSNLISYNLSSELLTSGHGDWRYDEFRLDAHGNLIHEIEWWSISGEARWTLVASDLEHKWVAASAT